MADSRATSFGAEAQNYEAGRPDYPFEAVAWMLETLPAGAARVADVGAGTGKLTRALAAAPGAQVVAIDPDPDMLVALRAGVRGIPTFLGSAESLPLPDDSLDAVVLGQAWHWVDPVAASREVGRVLHHGGVLGLIWNLRDERTEWVAKLSRIMHRSAAEEMLADADPPLASPFDALESESWEWAQPMTRDQLHRMASSRSAVIAADADERARIHREMDELFDSLPFDGGTIEMPYVTKAFRSRLERP